MAYDGRVVIKIDGDAKEFQSKLAGLEKAGKAALGALTTAAAATGAALAGIGAYAVKVGSDFEAGMSQVQAISGATGEDLEALKAKAKEMGATTKFSATQSAEALQYMAMAGWKTEQMTAGLPGIMNLAAASGESLASVSDIVTDALTAFGLKAEDSAHFADVLAKASSNSNTNVAMMGETFKYAAPVAGALGYSIEDVAVATGLMANSGIKAEMAGTALRGMLTNLAKPTRMTSKYIDGLGLSLTDAGGQMKPLSALMDELRDKFAGLTEEQKAEYAAGIAGKEAMSGLLAIVNASEADYQKLTAAIADANGAAKQQADIMNDNLQGAMTLLGSNLEGVGIQIYDSLEKPLKEAVRSANDSVTKISRSLKSGELKSAMQTISQAVGNLITAFAQFAAKAIPPVISAVAKIVQNGDRLIRMLQGAAAAFVALKAASLASAALHAFHIASTQVTLAIQAGNVALTAKQLLVGALTGKIGLATAAQTAWNTAMSANPIGMIVMAIGSLIAALSFACSAYEEEVTAADKVIAKNKELQAEHEVWLDQQQTMKDARNDAISLSNAENIKLENYIESLKRCVDENGRVKAGYEDRAAYLTEQINELIPGAIEANQDEAGSYIAICDNIDLLIAKKKKEAIANAYQAEYEEALKNVTAAQQDVIEAEENAAQAKQDLIDKQTAYNEAFAVYQNAKDIPGMNIDKEIADLAQAQDALHDAATAYEGCAQQADNARTKANGFVDMLDRMNALDMAETPEQIDAALAALNTGIVAASEMSASEIRQQLDRAIQARDQAIQALQDPALPAAMRLTQQQIAQEAQAGLEQLSHAYENAGGTLTSSMVLSINAGKGAVEDACYGAGQESATGYAAGLAAAQGEAENSAAEIQRICTAALDGDTTPEGQKFMHGFVQAVLASDPSPEVADMAKRSLDLLTTALHAGETATAQGAQRLLATWRESLDTGQPDVETAMELVAAGVLTKADIVADMATMGVNISQGLAQGIEDGTSYAVNAAAVAMNRVLDTFKRVAEINSPSRRMRREVGRMLPAGLALGIEDGAPAVLQTVEALSEAAIACARDEAKSYREIGSQYIENLTFGVESMRDKSINAIEQAVKADTEAYKKQIDQQTEALTTAKKKQLEAANEALQKGIDGQSKTLTTAKKKQLEAANKAQKEALQKEIDQIKADASDKKKAYEEAGKQATSAYKTALSEGFADALNLVKSRVSALTDEFQQAHDDLTRQQESMQSKLSGFGDLFTMDKSGDLSLGKIEQNIEAVRRYDQALTKLAERGVSDEFMQKVTALGVEEGTKFAEKLVGLSRDGFSTYIEAWDEQQRLSKEVASRFYADQLGTLDSDFQRKLNAVLADAPQTLAQLGAESLQGWAKGLTAQIDGASQDVQSMLSGLITAFGKAGQASPVTDSGQAVGMAFADGIARQIPLAVSAAQAMAQAVAAVLGNSLANTEGADGAQENGVQTVQAYAGGIAAQLGQVAQAAQGTADTFSGTVLQALPQVQKAGDHVMGALTDAVAARQGAVRSSAEQTVKSFCSAVSARYGQFRQTGLYAMQGLETGLREGGQAAISTAAWIADSIISEMQRALDIHSPSRKMAKLVGKPAAQGVAVGFEQEMANVYRQVSRTLDGELSRLSADVHIDADRAAASSPAPVQTILQREHIENTPKLVMSGDAAGLMRYLYPHWENEYKRRGKNLRKGSV